jgi:tetratricopeptide (TPR) repeat protein
MDIKDLINNGWGRHDKESEALATDLEGHFALAETAAQVGAFVQLANHTIGEHLGDWPRACALAEKVMDGREDSPELAGPYGSLAVAQYMSGKVADALASEAHAVRLADSDKLSAVVRTRAMAAGALIGSGRLDEGVKVYEAALALARSQEGKLACDKALAITSNNLASELSEKAERSEPEDALMLKAAEAAREFWLKCGTWENEERAEYLLATVHNRLSRPDQALEHAARAIEVIQANGEEVVDEAFINLAMAKSFHLRNDREHYDRAMARAQELADDFKDEGLRTWFIETKAKVEWK